MNPVLIKLGSFEIRWYSICILLGIVAAYLYIRSEAKKYNEPKDFMFNLTFWTVLFGLIGARFYYVIFNWQLYSHDIFAIFRFWEGGLAIHGGIIVGLITIYIYCRKKKARFSKITDIAVPGVLLAQAFGRWGNFFNSEAHGPATTLATLKSYGIIPGFVIDGMNINGIYYEPTFYYESLWCVLGFIICLIIKNAKNTKIGDLTAFYLMWYGAGRFLIESLRTDSLMLGGLKVAQVISFIMIIIGIVILIVNSNKKQYDDLYKDVNIDDIRF